MDTNQTPPPVNIKSSLAPNISPNPSPRLTINSKLLFYILGVGLILAVGAGSLFLGKYLYNPKTSFAPSIPIISPTSAASLSPVFDSESSPSSVENWTKYRNESLQYEFSYPPNPLEPMRELSDTSFVIGYFLDEGNRNDIRDVQNPDKTYWISLGYISQKQLSVMGITYCGANPNDSSRCESFTVGGQTSTIDWNIPVEYTKINDYGKEEEASQIKATVWIPDSKGGIVTFELQPVVPKSKETLYKILSTFRFL